MDAGLCFMVFDGWLRQVAALLGSSRIEDYKTWTIRKMKDVTLCYMLTTVAMRPLVHMLLSFILASLAWLFHGPELCCVETPGAQNVRLSRDRWGFCWHWQTQAQCLTDRLARQVASFQTFKLASFKKSQICRVF